jgi:CBS domain-containing protein
MRAADVMTKDVLTVRSETPVSVIAKLLLEQQISAVPVVDDKGKLVGIISEGDLLHRRELGTERRRWRWLDFFVYNIRLADEYVRAHGTKAEDVMSRPVISAKPDTPLDEIVHLMEKNRIKRMPIADDSGKLLGLVTRSNLVRALALTPSAEQVTLDDLSIRDLLLAELRRQPWAGNRDSDIVVTDGAVHIWGTVGSQEESQALVTAAKAIPGVKRVCDHTSVPHPYPYVFGG